MENTRALDEQVAFLKRKEQQRKDEERRYRLG